MATSKCALLLVVAALVVSANAQCCMWCPNGAAIADSFANPPPPAPAAHTAATKALDALLEGAEHKYQSASALGARASAGAGAGAGASYPVTTAVMMFNVPPLPTVLNANLTSTLFSAVISQWGANTYSAIALLTLDAAYGPAGAWALQALIQKNGVTVVQSALTHTYPGPSHEVSVTITQPQYIVATELSVVISDPYTGILRAQLGGFPLAPPDTNAWQVGWGWSGVDTDCSVFPPGDSVQMTDMAAVGPNGFYPLNFTTTNTLTPFCGLTSTAVWDPTIDRGTVSFNYSTPITA